MNNVNSLVICRDNYESQEKFESAIKNAVMLLLDADYIMTVRYDEPSLGIVVINYEAADQSWGCPYPYWLSPEESDNVMRDDKKGLFSSPEYDQSEQEEIEEFFKHF